MAMIRLGLIGYGNMGSAHARNIRDGKCPEVRVCAIADRSEARRARMREEQPDAVIYAEGAELIRHAQVDAVLIAVPHEQHPELAVAAFARGLHVLCEKPAGVYTLQVRQMNEAAARSGKTFGMMFNQRTNPMYIEMHRLLHSGELGRVKRVNWIVTDWYRTQSYYDSSAWRATWRGEGGGVLLNQCPHNLDMLQWLCGMPTLVDAHLHYGKWHDIEVEDDVTAYLEFAGGATGVFVTTTGDAPGTNRLEVTTEMGKLVCENDTLTLHRLAENERIWCCTSQEGFAKPPCTVETVPVSGDNPQHAGVLNAFAAHILRGEPLTADGAEGIHSLMLSNAMHLSSWLGKPVTLPFDEELFLRLLRERQATSRVKEDRGIVFSTEGSYGNAAKEK